MSNGNDKDDASSPEGAPAEGNGAALESGRPAVAAAPGKMMFILGAGLLFLGIVIKELFFSASAPVVKEKKHIAESVAQPVKSSDVLPALPPPPPPDKTLPEPPQPPPIQTPQPPNFASATAPSNEALKARYKSSMIISGGGLHGLMGGGDSKSTKRPPTNDPNSAFAEGLEGTTAAHVEATSLGNLNVTIAQGKIISAVLETGINTDLPGSLRAIVSHDVYAEAGRAILIPKGSRLIGVYNPSIKRGQTRVFIVWTRVIRPDGVDVAINSPGIDTLGRGGAAGYVDDKYFEAFSAAFLTSVLDIGTAVAATQLPGGNVSTTSTTNSNGTTTTSTPTAQATQQGVQNITQVGTGIVGNTLGLAPTITIDQGTLVNVFVNKDLSFPGISHFID